MIPNITTLHGQHNLFTRSAHSSTFSCASFECFCEFIQSPSPSPPSCSSSNLHLMHNASTLPPALQFGPTQDFNHLNSFARCLIHCSSYNALSNLFCFTVPPAIPFITTFFPNLKQFPFPIYGNKNMIIPPPSFWVSWLAIGLATGFTSNI